MEEFEWPPSTSTLQATNFTSEGISEFCTNWMKTIKSAVVVPDRSRHIRPSNFISKLSSRQTVFCGSSNFILNVECKNMMHTQESAARSLRK